MNLLLLQEADISGETARVEGRRAAHVLRVLKKAKGETIRAGVAHRGTCDATIVGTTNESITLALGALTSAHEPHWHVVLALPRPKALSRVVSAVASFGVGRLVLINAWRVEKSYFDSPRLNVQRLTEDAALGCEQGAHVWMPRIEIVRSFRQFVEDRDPEFFDPASFDRLVLHPQSPMTLGAALGTRGPFPRQTVLAVGPEGGFIEPELESWHRAGYAAARLETGPLKTEVALAAALGQLALLRPRH